MIGDDLAATIRNLANQDRIEQRSWVYGHISAYNPNDHTARVIVPSMLDDQTMAPLHSGWMPIGTGSVGSKFGLQMVPFGGATAEKPTTGELCLVALNERGTGVAAIVCTFFTSANQPPNVALESEKQLKPGEIIVVHSSGTFTRFHANGDLETATGGDGAVSVATSGKGGVSVTTSGAGGVTVTTSGDAGISLTSSGGGTIAMKSGNPITIDGDLKVTGEVTAMDGTGGSVTLSQHRTSGVQTGGSQSGVPVAGT